MHQFLESLKHVFDFVFAAIAAVSVAQLLTLATSIMTLFGATLTVLWYWFRLRDYLKNRKAN